MTNNMYVAVFDEKGNKKGMTYPKRARGLIKKGRAVPCGENQIQLCGFCPSELNSEDITMSDNTINNTNINNDNIEQKQNLHNIPFIAKDWHFVADTKKVGNRMFFNNYVDDLVCGFSLGNWNWDWVEIFNTMRLEKNSIYTISFWLNGGENDRNDSQCQFFYFSYDNPYNHEEILKALEAKSIFMLNRNYIKYKAHCNGWYLYELPVVTDDKEFTELRFVAQCAPCAIISANPNEDISQLPLSEPPKNVPQRSNLVFPEGYPRNCSWSHLVFGDENKVKNNSDKNANFNDVNMNITDNDDDSVYFEDVANDISRDIAKQIRNAIFENFEESIDDIDDIDVKEIVTELLENADFDEYNQIIKDALTE